MEITLIKADRTEVKTTFEKLLKESKKTILYFYPKDNTSGCSLEARNFTMHKKEFNDLWIQIIWVSKDSVKSHCSFIEKEELNIDLISDENLELQNKFWVIWEKSMYWKKYLWTIRSTFLLDNEGNILKEYRNVKVPNHIETILAELK